MPLLNLSLRLADGAALAHRADPELLSADT